MNLCRCIKKSITVHLHYICFCILVIVYLHIICTSPFLLVSLFSTTQFHNRCIQCYDMIFKYFIKLNPVRKSCNIMSHNVSLRFWNWTIIHKQSFLISILFIYSFIGYSFEGIWDIIVKRFWKFFFHVFKFNLRNFDIFM